MVVPVVLALALVLVLVLVLVLAVAKLPVLCHPGCAFPVCGVQADVPSTFGLASGSESLV